MNREIDKSSLQVAQGGEWQEGNLDPPSEGELDLVLETVACRYGYDFRQYSRKVLRRRLNLFRSRCGVRYLSDVIPLLLHNRETLQQLLQTLSITVTEFFRGPAFFSAFRRTVVPVLRTYPFISLWCAGCATGEEAYSWAIVLHEAGLLERSCIYATDFNTEALQAAKYGVYSQELYRKGYANYQLFGGRQHFNRYCQVGLGSVKMSASLQDHITFVSHNLVHDGVFGEMTVIACRNVMIYFNSTLKWRCLNLFYDSLCSQGFLCLGDSETIEYSHSAHIFSTFDRQSRIYRKIAVPEKIWTTQRRGNQTNLPEQ